MLTITQLSLQRERRLVLDQITVAAQQHQVTALLGPNGAGKSSLLAIAAGELMPHSGSCQLDKVDLHQASAASLARLRAFLPQSSQLEFDFNVRQVVRMGGMPFPELPAPEFEGLIDSVLCLLEIQNLAKRHYLSLSGGERQRVQLARVIIQACAAASFAPALLLLDEPCAGLDLRHQHTLMVGLHELSRRLPLAVVLSLHDINLALDYADYAWLLEHGQLVAHGNPQQTLQPELISKVFGIGVNRQGHHLSFGLIQV